MRLSLFYTLFALLFAGVLSCPHAGKNDGKHGVKHYGKHQGKYQDKKGQGASWGGVSGKDAAGMKALAYYGNWVRREKANVPYDMIMTNSCRTSMAAVSWSPTSPLTS
jgi:hypothetical protein